MNGTFMIYFFTRAVPNSKNKDTVVKKKIVGNFSNREPKKTIFNYRQPTSSVFFWSHVGHMLSLVGLPGKQNL